MPEAAPYSPAELTLLSKIRLEVEKGLATTRSGDMHWACLNRAYYDLDNERFIPRRPAEDQQDYDSRPKRTSSMTRRAVELLCEHLYNPGPARRLESGGEADTWYQGVARDVDLDALWQDADELSTLNGTVAFQAAATGDESRPIKLHLWDRGDLEFWADPLDPTCPFAIVTIDRQDERTTFKLWTRLDVEVYRTAGLGQKQTAGGRVATYVPDESGPHGYGRLPFELVHYRKPTDGLQAVALGTTLRRANAGVDVAMSNLAEACEFYGRPIGFARNVDIKWQPRVRPGSFTHLPNREKNAAGMGDPPEAFYLQAALDVAGLWLDITNFANAKFEEMGVPLSAARMEQSGVVSGIAIVAEQAPLLTRATKRQRPAARQESALCSLCLAVAGAYYGNAGFVALAADPKLSLSWPEPRIPIPGPDRDAEDQSELDWGITSRVEILMRRRGMTREQAEAHIEQMAEDEAKVNELRAALMPEPVAVDPLTGEPVKQVDPGGNGPPGKDPSKGDSES